MDQAVPELCGAGRVREGVRGDHVVAVSRYARLFPFFPLRKFRLTSLRFYSQMTCLAHFISVVCENGATALLTQYSFAGLEADLERNLAFRARNSDPLARPNYYKVLYAYHISKGDYRSGSSRLFLFSIPS